MSIITSIGYCNAMRNPTLTQVHAHDSAKKNVIKYDIDFPSTEIDDHDTHLKYLAGALYNSQQLVEEAEVSANLLLHSFALQNFMRSACRVVYFYRKFDKDCAFVKGHAHNVKLSVNATTIVTLHDLFQHVVRAATKSGIHIPNLNEEKIIDVLYENAACYTSKGPLKYVDYCVDCIRGVHFDTVKSAFEKIIRHKININTPDSHGFQLIFYAVLIDRVSVVELLIRLGANPNVMLGLGIPPLFIANSPEMRKVLLKHQKNRQTHGADETSLKIMALEKLANQKLSPDKDRCVHQRPRGVNMQRKQAFKKALVMLNKIWNDHASPKLEQLPTVLTDSTMKLYEDYKSWLKKHNQTLTEKICPHCTQEGRNCALKTLADMEKIADGKAYWCARCHEIVEQ